jgi:3-dehydroquinate synthase
VTGKARPGSALRRIRVALGERSYPVVLGSGNLALAGPAIAQRSGAGLAVIVSVPAVARRYAPALERSLRGAGLRVRRIVVPDGDRSKRLEIVERLYRRLLALGGDRATTLVALGGGMVGDLAGFTAATFLRGVPFVQVPTSVLAMVDASVGGKVGVNLPQGKNLVGAFHQPRLVWIDVETLASLPRRQRSAGFAEVVKAGALWDAAFFERLERDAEALMALDRRRLVPALARAIAIKAEIVSQDEREAGPRMLLNLGHTLAHAVEALTGFRSVLHGEAVAMGMVYAARRSEQLGLAAAGIADRIQGLLRRFELPTELPDFPRRAYLAALGVDKKKRDGKIRYVALRRIGRAETVPLSAARILPPGAVGASGPGRRAAAWRRR